MGPPTSQPASLPPHLLPAPPPQPQPPLLQQVRVPFRILLSTCAPLLTLCSECAHLFSHFAQNVRTSFHTLLKMCAPLLTLCSEGAHLFSHSAQNVRTAFHTLLKMCAQFSHLTQCPCAYPTPSSRPRAFTCICVGLAKTIYIRCVYVIFGREITIYTVIYSVYIRFWPTLHMCLFTLCLHAGSTLFLSPYAYVPALMCPTCTHALFHTSLMPRSYKMP
jgi:hypothetical protein